MNRLYWIVALAGLLWSCGGKKEEELTVNPIDSTTYKPLGYVDGVLSWASPQSYSVNTYYTLVDTVTSPVLIAMPLSVTTTEEESVSISWLINDQSVAGTTQQKGWDQISQKWFYSSTLAVPTNPYKASIPVKAVVYFQKTSKTANRTATLNLKQTKKTTDVLGVNFGMTREQVRQAEAERFGALTAVTWAWTEYSPNLASTVMSNNLNSTFYAFENNALKSVSEIANYREVDPRLKALAEKYRIPEEIKYVNSFMLAKDYVWTNGKIKFTVSQKAFSTSEKLASITYEKQ